MSPTTTLALAIRQRVAALPDAELVQEFGRPAATKLGDTPPPDPDHWTAAGEPRKPRPRPRKSKRVAEFDASVLKLLRGSDMALSVGFIAQRLGATKHAVQRSLARMKPVGQVFMANTRKFARWADTVAKALAAEPGGADA